MLLTLVCEQIRQDDENIEERLEMFKEHLRVTCIIVLDDITAYLLGLMATPKEDSDFKENRKQQRLNVMLSSEVKKVHDSNSQPLTDTTLDSNAYDPILTPKLHIQMYPMS